MPLFVATWPDKSVSVFRLTGEWTETDVFWSLDLEGNPFDAKVLMICGNEPHFCIDPAKGADPASVSVFEGRASGFSFTDGVASRAYGIVRKDDAEGPDDAA